MCIRDSLEPMFGFNLHDQRVGYRVGDSDRGTAIALLAPPFDETRGVNEVRARAIEVAAIIRAALEPRIAGYIARWDDTFNPRAVSYTHLDVYKRQIYRCMFSLKFSQISTTTFHELSLQ